MENDKHNFSERSIENIKRENEEALGEGSFG